MDALCSLRLFLKKLGDWVYNLISTLERIQKRTALAMIIIHDCIVCYI